MILPPVLASQNLHRRPDSVRVGIKWDCMQGSLGVAKGYKQVTVALNVTRHLRVKRTTNLPNSATKRLRLRHKRTLRPLGEGATNTLSVLRLGWIYTISSVKHDPVSTKLGHGWRPELLRPRSPCRRSGHGLNSQAVLLTAGVLPIDVIRLRDRCPQVIIGAIDKKLCVHPNNRGVGSFR
ncbi:unannotated protein [freshwater metagenome]|uniref:Unannotated protein n=1 Tax=freshwater metagenome TaxID=449393 RepID=A0A6J7SIN1_9ZZZZ